MRRWLGLVLLLVSLWGCSERKSAYENPFLFGPTGSCDNGDFTVKVHPAVAGLYWSEVTTAFQKWEDQMEGKVTFDVVVDPFAQASWKDCEITVMWDDLKDSQMGLAVWHSPHGKPFGVKNAAATIFLNTRRMDEFNADVTYSVLLHEVGHVMGLDHDTSEEHKTIMDPPVVVPGNIGCEDVRKACAAWECTAQCEGNGWVQ